MKLPQKSYTIPFKGFLNEGTKAAEPFNSREEDSHGGPCYISPYMNL